MTLNLFPFALFVSFVFKKCSKKTAELNFFKISNHKNLQG